MRYKITHELKTILKQRKRELLNSDKRLKWPIKNVIYNNVSISDDLLNEICNKLQININNLDMKKIDFHKEKNFGTHLNPIEVKFTGVNENFAEFIGIMLGDGNIYKNSVRIMMDKREIPYREYIKNLGHHLFKLNFNEYDAKATNQFRLYKDSKNLTELLLSYGLKRGNKIKNQVGVPDWILKNEMYSTRCIRGLVDTDGCVFWNKRDKRMYITFSNSSPKLLRDFKSITCKMGLKFANSGPNHVCLYRRGEIERYIKRIGFSNRKHIDKINYYGGFLDDQGAVV
ncbi:hypothetical protein HYX03_02695 [Candidatus Woesearchaeota archaeon]|nr:hypothetical protein [Candidatus Woesearchaeota archaeon]